MTKIKIKLVNNIGIDDSNNVLLRKWIRMIKYCYPISDSEIKQAKHKGEPTMCHEWIKFSEFQKWAIFEDYEESYLLKKDNHYSPDSCYFKRYN